MTLMLEFEPDSVQ